MGAFDQSFAQGYGLMMERQRQEETRRRFEIEQRRLREVMQRQAEQESFAREQDRIAAQRKATTEAESALDTGLKAAGTMPAEAVNAMWARQWKLMGYPGEVPKLTPNDQHLGGGFKLKDWQGQERVVDPVGERRRSAALQAQQYGAMTGRPMGWDQGPIAGQGPLSPQTQEALGGPDAELMALMDRGPRGTAAPSRYPSRRGPLDVMTHSPEELMRGAGRAPLAEAGELEAILAGRTASPLRPRPSDPVVDLYMASMQAGVPTKTLEKGLGASRGRSTEDLTALEAQKQAGRERLAEIRSRATLGAARIRAAAQAARDAGRPDEATKILRDAIRDEERAAAAAGAEAARLESEAGRQEGLLVKPGKYAEQALTGADRKRVQDRIAGFTAKSGELQAEAAARREAVEELRADLKTRLRVKKKPKGAAAPAAPPTANETKLAAKYGISVAELRKRIAEGR